MRPTAAIRWSWQDCSRFERRQGMKLYTQVTSANSGACGPIDSPCRTISQAIANATQATGLVGTASTAA
jgi:hypothetical protein